MAGLDTSSLTSGWDLPLTVLTSAVRCLVMISHIFTQDSQFCWMLDTLSDIYSRLYVFAVERGVL